MDSFVVHIGSVDGTEAWNVDRMMSYAAEQLGLKLSDAQCAEDWRAYRAVLSGEQTTVVHLMNLVGSAYPAAEISLKQV